MKNAKRDITLNESDSLADMLFFEKGLIQAYVSAIFCAERKEERALLTKSFCSVAEETFLLVDLITARK